MQELLTLVEYSTNVITRNEVPSEEDYKRNTEHLGGIIRSRIALLLSEKKSGADKHEEKSVPPMQTRSVIKQPPHSHRKKKGLS